ncbi:helix-turn-helix transcriptional regulator [Lysinibacillus sp. LZ02]|uniref:helix-turn-helix transcriptional regulator n=1 Tax=Lysinibacillus sp. LZ02 TaxID=3420668 RepID=UPI003D36DF34
MNKRLDWREDMDEYIRLVNKSEDYIESHLSEKISLDDLANNANMSKYHFHRLFRKYNNETVKQFVTRIKVERSGIFLAVRNDLSITDIALRYGYNDASTFNKAFKKYIGMSPLEYRKARNDKK